MPNVGTGTLTEFGMALDLRQNYRWLGGEEDRVNQRGGRGLVGDFEFQRYFYWVSENVYHVHIRKKNMSKASNEVSYSI